MRFAQWTVLGVCALATAPAIGQEQTAFGPAVEQQATATACCRVPAGTAVDLEIMDTINSSQHKRGDRFAIRVTAPVLVDGVVAIPAGTLGVGEVVHASAARGGGAPGELLIAARTLDVGGHSIPMRGLRLGRSGQSNSALALGLSTAIGPFAMFVRGREIEIPASTAVVAKVANDATTIPAASAPADTTPEE